jgi:hypothetical protein
MEILGHRNSYLLLTKCNAFCIKRAALKATSFNKRLQKIYGIFVPYVGLLVQLYNELLSASCLLSVNHPTRNIIPLLYYSVRLLSAWHYKTNDSTLSRSSDLPQQRKCMRVQLQTAANCIRAARYDSSCNVGARNQEHRLKSRFTAECEACDDFLCSDHDSARCTETFAQACEGMNTARWEQRGPQCSINGVPDLLYICLILPVAVRPRFVLHRRHITPPLQSPAS